MIVYVISIAIWSAAFNAVMACTYHKPPVYDMSTQPGIIRVSLRINNAEVEACVDAVLKAERDKQ